MSYLKPIPSLLSHAPWIAGLVASLACGSSAPSAEGGSTGAAGSTESSESSESAGSSAASGSEGPTGSTGSGGGDTGSTTEVNAGSTGTTGLGSTETSGSGSSTGAAECVKTVVLMGYWPPTNEMLRPFSTDPELNPDGWQGENWRGLGFDVHAFFPEFPPDGDPSNDPIGSPGSVGVGDLQVDYQDTSADFWSIVDTLQPHIIITHSRGGSIGWEIEAVEGGHGSGGPNPAFDWISDGFGAQTRPTEDSVDPRSWAAMNTYRDVNAQSLLPLAEIEAAADALAVTDVQIDATGTSGNYLSGFLGLHGIVYVESTPHAVAGGHIHVGIGLPVEDAQALTEASLEAVLAAHPVETLECPTPG